MQPPILWLQKNDIWSLEVIQNRVRERLALIVKRTEYTRDKLNGQKSCFCSLTQMRDYECSVHRSSVHPLGTDPLAVEAMPMGYTGRKTFLPLQTRLHCCPLLSTSRLKMCSVNLSGFLSHLRRVIIGAENKWSLTHSSQELITKATTTTATIFESLYYGVAQLLSRVRPCNLMDCCLPGSSVHGILQARILEWVAIPFSRGSSWPRDRIWIFWIVSRFFFIIWIIREAPHYTLVLTYLLTRNLYLLIIFFQFLPSITLYLW